jgi:hypothetical protein
MLPLPLLPLPLLPLPLLPLPLLPLPLLPLLLLLLPLLLLLLLLLLPELEPVLPEITSVHHVVTSSRSWVMSETCPLSQTRTAHLPASTPSSNCSETEMPPPLQKHLISFCAVLSGSMLQDLTTLPKAWSKQSRAQLGTLLSQLE